MCGISEDYGLVESLGGNGEGVRALLLATFSWGRGWCCSLFSTTQPRVPEPLAHVCCENCHYLKNSCFCVVLTSVQCCFPETDPPESPR